jgi:putative oxidoreductase
MVRDVMSTKEKLKDFGILLLRVGVGLGFVLIHGWPKIYGGPELWTRLGGSMGNFGITFAPQLWGAMSAFAEFGGGMLLILGLLTRPVAFILAFDMVVASATHFAKLDPWVVASHPLKLIAVFVALIFTGAGRYSLDYLIFRKRKTEVTEVHKATEVHEVPPLKRAS